MSQIMPFAALRPRNDLATEVIAPPYDVVSAAEARAIAGPNPRSFLHVTRPDADLAPGADIHGALAYATARANLDRFVAEGWLVKDPEPRFYVYEQAWRGRTQVGLLATCSVEEYDAGRIKKHELTRPDKEEDRVAHIEATDAQTGLVFLAYRDRPDVAAVMAEAAASPQAWSVTTDDAVTHTLRPVAPSSNARIQEAFGRTGALYVADGHHRSAAASRVAAARRGAGTSGWFLAGIFPDTQLRVLAYNRLVRDLHGRSPAEFLGAVGAAFEVTRGVPAEPPARGSMTVYLDGAWHGLLPRPGVVPADPVGSLDVSVLQDRILGPLLGIADPRTDTRISFVGGIRGHAALCDAVDRGEAAVAFRLFPTGLDQLFAVADAGRLMPPKSTWFEPKLRGGVVVHRIA